LYPELVTTAVLGYISSSVYRAKQALSYPNDTSLNALLADIYAQLKF